MTRRRLGIGIGVVVALLFVALIVRFLAAEDEMAIENSIEEVATSSDPSFCTELVTPRYLQQILALPADAAISSCEQYADEEVLQADSVEVERIEIDGDRATAEATYRGSVADGTTLDVALVHEDGEWKLDGEQVAELDRAGFLSAYREQLTDPLYGFPPTSAGCVVARLGELPDSQLEGLMIAPDPSQIGRLLIACDRTGTEGLLVRPFREPPPYPTAQIECVESKVRQSTPAELLALYVDPRGLIAGCEQ